MICNTSVTRAIILAYPRHNHIQWKQHHVTLADQWENDEPACHSGEDHGCLPVTGSDGKAAIFPQSLFFRGDNNDASIPPNKNPPPRWFIRSERCWKGFTWVLYFVFDLKVTLVFPCVYLWVVLFTFLYASFPHLPVFFLDKIDVSFQSASIFFLLILA